MEIKIRTAVEADCTRMMELIRELALYEKAPDEVTVSESHFRDSGFGPHPVWWAEVAELTEAGQEPVIVGFALWYIRYSTWKGQRLYLEDLLVTEHWRGKGIGKLLFDKIIDITRQRGFHGMCWQVLEWNEPALNFYKKYEGVSFDEEWLNGSLS
jgi:GNAT superfamily N-acetyltransferase